MIHRLKIGFQYVSLSGACGIGASGGDVRNMRCKYIWVGSSLNPSIIDSSSNVHLTPFGEFLVVHMDINRKNLPPKISHVRI